MTPPDGATRLYGIIGDPVAQVKSPAVFNEKFRALGVNAVMVAVHARPDGFDDCMRGLKTLGNLDGLLVTLPYKGAALAHVEEILPAARRIGAVNALRREADGHWSGDMFDGQGFVAGLRASSLEPQGLSAMLIGAGGAGSAIADALAESGLAAITLFDRDTAKSEALAARLRQNHPACKVDVRPPTLVNKQLLINATPTGMAAGDGLPAELGPLDPSLFVADIIPAPEVTPLLAFARAGGCRTMGGAAMVRGQADAILRFFGL